MRAADLLEPFVKSGTVTDLPPRTLIYTLSAPSVPDVIRDVYLPRVLAGEKVGSALRQAVRDHRQQAKCRTAPSIEAEATHVEPEAEEQDLKRQRQSEFRLAALSLIQARFGDDLPELMNLVANAGHGSVFSLDAERALGEFAWEMTKPQPPIDGAVHIGGEMQAESSDVEAVNVEGSSEAGPVSSGDAVEPSVAAFDSGASESGQSNLDDSSQNSVPFAVGKPEGEDVPVARLPVGPRVSQNKVTFGRPRSRVLSLPRRRSPSLP